MSTDWSSPTPEYLNRDPIELLLGADAYASIVLPNLRRGGPLEPIAQQMHLGWILLSAVGVGHAASAVTSLQCSPLDDLAAAVRRFWEWEEPPSSALPLSAIDQACEDHFAQTHQRLPDGRYQVRLPVRPDLPDLSSTRRAALRMLEVMARRFDRDADFRDKYRDFMREYIALGHMSPLLQHVPATRDRVCYLPHHGVLRSSDTAAKIRVVPHRNPGRDFLERPNLLPALTDVVLRWRRHRYVFVADVEKMYRQIAVHPDDRSLQQVLWKEKEQVSEYSLNTVTYGMACAPFLALRVLQQLAGDEESRFPLGAEALRLHGRHTYRSSHPGVESSSAGRGLFTLYGGRLPLEKVGCKPRGAPGGRPARTPAALFRRCSTAIR